MVSRSAQLFDLHRQIHDVRQKISEIHAQRRRLAALFLQFNQLAVDKLALDAVQQPRFNHSELSSYAFRVISDRIQAAARYFEPHNMPLLVPQASEFAKEKPKDSPWTSVQSSRIKTSTSSETNHTSSSSSQPQMPRIPNSVSWFHPLTLSRASAQKKLDCLKDELVLLQSDYEGLSLCVQRFCNDNVALQSEVTTQRRNIHQLSPPTISASDTLWKKLANTDLLPNSSVNNSIGSRNRRNSTASTIRLSFTTTTNPNTERFADFKNNWESCSIYERRRQSQIAISDAAEMPSMYRSNALEYTKPPRPVPPIPPARSLAHVNLTPLKYSFSHPSSIRMVV